MKNATFFTGLPVLICAPLQLSLAASKWSESNLMLSSVVLLITTETIRVSLEETLRAPPAVRALPKSVPNDPSLEPTLVFLAVASTPAATRSAVVSPPSKTAIMLSVFTSRPVATTGTVDVELVAEPTSFQISYSSPVAASPAASPTTPNHPRDPQPLQEIGKEKELPLNTNPSTRLYTKKPDHKWPSFLFKRGSRV